VYILLVIILILILLMVLKVPVPYALALSAIVGFALLALFVPTRNFSFGLIAQRLVRGVDSFPLLAIPLFIFAGKVMNRGSITERLFSFASAVVGPVRGGLGHVNILASLIFSGMSGAAVADVAGLGSIEIKAMKDAGYDPPFCCAVTGASSIIGPIIPPSIPMVVYAVLAGVSTGKMFLGGIIPGLLMGVSLMVMVAIISHRRRYPVGERTSLKGIFTVFRRSFLPLLTPVIIVGGIWTGHFTPTEAACIGSVYALILAALVYRIAGWKDIVQLLKETMNDSISILLILSAASLYSGSLALLRIPDMIAAYLAGFSKSPMLLLVLINIFLLGIGFFMPAMVTINVFTPILVPIMSSLGIDPIFFGVVMVLNVMIGMLTPPFGIVLFTLAKVSDTPLREVMREMVPFIVTLVVVLAILLIFPQLVTYIPNRIGL
jgi:tripartite ATP-independent transporter DctM subunit